MVLIRPYLIPGFFIIIAIAGVAALGVQEALVVILESDNIASLTFGVAVIVCPSSRAGAERTTLLAPASRCSFALSKEVKRPVDSTTISISKSFHGNFDGSGSLTYFIFLPSTT